jgi:hypothetical protein
MNKILTASTTLYEKLILFTEAAKRKDAGSIVIKAKPKIETINP